MAVSISPIFNAKLGSGGSENGPRKGAAAAAGGARALAAGGEPVPGASGREL